MSPRKTVGWRPTGGDRADYRRAGAPMLLLGFGLAQAGVAALLDPAAADQTSVARVLDRDLHGVELFWQLSYVAAGTLILVGVLWPWPIGEVLGEWLAGWAMFLNALALVALRGLAGAGTSLGAFLVAIGVCYLRIRALHQLAAVERRERSFPFDGPDKRRT